MIPTTAQWLGLNVVCSNSSACAATDGKSATVQCCLCLYLCHPNDDSWPVTFWVISGTWNWIWNRHNIAIEKPLRRALSQTGLWTIAEDRQAKRRAATKQRDIAVNPRQTPHTRQSLSNNTRVHVTQQHEHQMSWGRREESPQGGAVPAERLRQTGDDGSISRRVVVQLEQRRCHQLVVARHGEQRCRQWYTMITHVHVSSPVSRSDITASKITTADNRCARRFLRMLNRWRTMSNQYSKYKADVM